MSWRQYIAFLKAWDRRTLLCIVLLILLSLATIYSIGLHAEVPTIAKFKTQLIALGIGIVCVLIASRLDYRMWYHLSWVILLLGVLILILVLLFGTTIHGTTGWIDLKWFIFQPVEIAKIMFILNLAAWITKYGNDTPFKALLGSGLITLLYTALVLLQPDFGSAALFVIVWTLAFLFIRIEFKARLIIILLLCIIPFITWFFLEDYQQNRIILLLNPQKDALGKGYNVIQSMISVGSGKLLGRGLGLGPQSQLKFLPEKETDFIFAVIAEELGFVGASVVLSGFLLLFFSLFRYIVKLKDTFGRWILLLSVLLLGVQMFINVGMNIGIMPITGIPLPFISAGGSSLVANLLLIGLIQSIIIRHKKQV
ncbi:MAG: hypothetical protein A3B74_04025 [Candidatus Kerfeldbacteria bacterium RIFCSPHIGHO2_02_FULL_42_14]|uniref:Probable peptidoglycan glycosyltransferase FtsW n=1 Tax=Candidatus Kerfeldbacteria bacterium RIFCSPHIGHO2_02_FULL_42_14 TaxID=1798540 RepID=A0A1G2AQ50_9BACT|nr:MAG: hypothetical protein A3B74_04025 [Candidatus Kerfeldbacteria bacterium RIFCSPHIGHO2_02_FULL_42_14]OGY80677.1 MAG: hypothetical protein A3E60_04520 [Candidatus Kerfeldbacteria bacterium RIFCSPHIGHO2_12_FULL_42_13]OGY82604.1 MAG: hypothetical protein A3I91_04185 [Candidatus Kerfeldbacteria bacterium RIFCSPLOWO2_02_FULL_42_19]OGY85207.1 MAG: hypothetical protein A3G01_01315 [Candidatus Kerfeldbacteria bacterium RIFCSPLOWO2_12_FULL_43_9]